MRILAIDPGPSLSAAVVIESEPLRIMSHDKEINDNILNAIIAESHRSECFVIEEIAHYGMPVGAEVFKTVFWSGRFYQASAMPVTMIPRHAVKMHLCHTCRAKDANIRAALIERFGEPGTKKNPGILYGIHGDCWQALALAITFAETKIYAHEK